MSVEEYLRNFGQRPRVLEKIQRAARAKRLHLVSLRTINLETKRYRREHRSKQ
jgi:hypothetical protein